MRLFFFILGRNPALSFAEIVALLKREKIDFQVKLISPPVLILALKESCSWQNLFPLLGGVLKMGEIEEIFTGERKNLGEILFSEKVLFSLRKLKKKRIRLGISFYSGEEKGFFSSFIHQAKTLNFSFLKEKFKEQGLRVGFLKIKDWALSPVSVTKNQLLTKGREVVFLLTKEKIFLGRTLAVQDFSGFSFRDAQRPRRNKRAGIMPVKLARMMINLAGKSQESFLLDPFCGSGTILQEAAILGYQNVFGSDIDPQAISATQENLGWLGKKLPESKDSLEKIKLFSSDVRNLGKIFPQNFFDLIVTEPYLGPPLFQKPSFSFVEKNFSQLSSLYLAAFQQFYFLLKPGGVVVILFPVFSVFHQRKFLAITPKIENLGFRKNDFFPQEFWSFFPQNLTPLGTILYGSEEQFLTREILFFEKKSG